MTTTPASTPTPGTTGTPVLDRFFATLHRSPVIRSQDRVIAGVSAGIADRLGVSRAIVRVGMVLLALLGPGVLLYLLAWLMLPDSQGRVRLERAVRGGEGGSIVLLVITGLSFFGELFGDRWDGPGGPGMHGHSAGIWPLLVVAGVALIGWKKGWFTRHQGRSTGSPMTPPASPPASPPAPQGPQDTPRV